MKVTNEKIENSQAFLTIEMEPAEVEESLEKSYHRLVKKTSIPGFRKGKAPRAILERYIGKEALLEDALNHLISQAYEKAIKEQEIEPIAQPHIEITQTAPVIFKATVPLPPTVKLGDYHHVQVTSQPVEVTEDEISSTLGQLRHQQATWEPVERPVDFNDLVVFDIESNIEDKPYINQKGAQYQVLHDLPSPVSGFADQLVGMKRGEEKEFNLQFPSDYSRSELAGKEAWFKVKITETKEERLPELNDDLAKQVNPDFKTLDSLREQVSTRLRRQAEEKARIDFEEQVIEAVIDLSQLEFPPILVEREIDRLLNQQLQRLQMGGIGLEEYLKSINKTGDELREELRSLATKRVTHSLLLEKIAKEEKIEASDSEISAELKKLIEGADKNKDELQRFLDTPQARESIKQLLIARKTTQHLVEIAKGTGAEKGDKTDGKTSS